MTMSIDAMTRKELLDAIASSLTEAFDGTLRDVVILDYITQAITLINQRESDDGLRNMLKTITEKRG